LVAQFIQVLLTRVTIGHTSTLQEEKRNQLILVTKLGVKLVMTNGWSLMTQLSEISSTQNSKRNALEENHLILEVLAFQAWMDGVLVEGVLMVNQDTCYSMKEERKSH
jgi:hypothetical protein